MCFFFHSCYPFHLEPPPTTTPAPNLQFRRVKVCCNYSGHFKEEKLFEKIEILARTLAPAHYSNFNQAEQTRALAGPPLRTSGFTFLSLIHKFLGYYSDSGSGGGGGGGNTFITS